MESRIVQNPALESEYLRVRSSTWLEILFDLVVAGTVTALGDAFGQRTTPESFGLFALTTCAVWQAWTGFTFFHNRFRADDLVHRCFVLLQLCAITVLGVAAADVMQGNGSVFSWGYAGVALVLAGFYARVGRGIPEARGLARAYASIYVAEVAIWVAAALLPPSWTRPLWATGCLLGFSFLFSRRARAFQERHPPNAQHVTHRYGMLVLVLLGEAVASVLGAASTGSSFLSAPPVWLTLVIAFCVFWLYFDDVAGSRVKPGTASSLVWVYSHFPLALGIAATGAGLRAAVHLTDPLPSALRWLVSGGLALTLLSVAMIDSVTDRAQAELGDRARINARLGSSLLALVLAPVSASMPAVEFLALAAALGITQVVFDLMLAPVMADLVAERAESTADIGKRRLEGASPSSPPIASLALARQGGALRLGTPSELRRDFYSFFIDGPWSRLVVSLVFGYLAVNTFFAALYLLEPGSLMNARPRAFADAFFFSVQTFSTIGYGGMIPATPYGNLVVTAEAAVGLLSAAFATGLMFAKAARPRSSALFSRSMILTRRDGVPYLVFRVGNARGNDVVDASISVTALKEEISAEGQHLRRQHDLNLVRSRSPFFTLTWVVMHEITKDSPLHDVDWNDPRDLVAIVATLTGHDGTYGQTTYARHVYAPTDVRVGHRFIDVLSQLPDGRMMIDYSKFHDTAADGSHPSGAPRPSNPEPE